MAKNWSIFTFVLVNVLNFTSSTDFNTLDLQQWDSYKTEHNKIYSSAELEQQKMKIYFDNANKIAEHNEKFKKGEVLYELEMNEFGDLTPEEIKKAHLSIMSSNLNIMSEVDGGNSHVLKSLPPNCGTVPKEKNWVVEGAVTNVKNQGYVCGCCWAFATAALIESHNYIHGPVKKLISLSPQNLIDCVDETPGMSNNCDGGSIQDPLDYVIKNNGIDTYQSYPYKEKEEKCHYKPENRGATIKDYKRLEQLNEKLLRDVIGVIGPTSCLMDASDDYFAFYKMGIYSSKVCKKSMDDMTHAIVIVGYGNEKGTDYWLVKNSWGENWGEKGYFRIARNTNECGISIAPFYPIL